MKSAAVIQSTFSHTVAAVMLTASCASSLYIYMVKQVNRSGPGVIKKELALMNVSALVASFLSNMHERHN